MRRPRRRAGGSRRSQGCPPAAASPRTPLPDSSTATVNSSSLAALMAAAAPWQVGAGRAGCPSSGGGRRRSGPAPPAAGSAAAGPGAPAGQSGLAAPGPPSAMLGLRLGGARVPRDGATCCRVSPDSPGSPSHVTVGAFSPSHSPGFNRGSTAEAGCGQSHPQGTAGPAHLMPTWGTGCVAA